MLRVWFGERKNAIDNTSVYFKNTYQDEWITEPFSREIIHAVDRSEVIDAQTIKSPVLGTIPPEKLSGGVKTLILMAHYPGKIFNASNCGNNCARWILELGERQNFTINLHHIMDFGPGEFQIRILNHRTLVAHDMREFLDAGSRYLLEVPRER